MDMLELKKLFEEGKHDTIIQLVDSESDPEAVILKGRALVSKGDYDQALQIAERYIQEEGLIRYDATVLKSIVLNYTGRLDEAKELSLGIVGHLSKLDEKLELSALNQSILGNIFSGKGELDQALKYYQNAMSIGKKIGNNSPIAGPLNNIGNIYLDWGELDQAMEYYTKSLVIQEKKGNNLSVAICLNNIGRVYRNKGELDHALSYFRKSLKLREEIGNKQRIATILGNIGSVCRFQGELNHALECFEKSLKFNKEIGNEQNIAWSFNNIGLVYRDKGELDLALEYQQKSLAISEKSGNKVNLAHILYWLIKTLLIKDRGAVEPYLEKLQEIAEEENNKIITQFAQLNNALFLKSSNRARLKAQAHNILEEIIKGELVHFLVTRDAMLHLCDILMDEYKNYEEEEVLIEVIDLLDQLYEMAQKQHSFSLSVETLILKARLEIIRGEYSQASKLLEQSLGIAKKKGITGSILKIEQEQQKMGENIDKWHDMLDKTSSVGERMEQVKLKNYLQSMIKFAEESSV
jgi:tetratricopeptide (TPR) repeat protein